MQTQQKPYLQDLFSLESLFIGGLSILTCAAFWAFTDKSLSVYTVSQFALTAAFVVNYPHFLSSYIMIYSDFKNKIFKNFRYFISAILVPVSLFSYFCYSLINSRADLIGHTVNAMYFLVGWHYVKQIFGCIIVTSIRRKIFYSKWEKNLFLVNLFSLWSISWAQGQVSGSTFNFYGINYFSFSTQDFILSAGYWVTALSLVGLVLMHFSKYIQQGALPSAPGLVAFASLYIWYIPTFYHPSFAYLIPFFHSLQYMTFVWKFKVNQTASVTEKFQGAEQRKMWVKYFTGFFLLSAVLGAISFELLPKFLDSQLLFQGDATMGTSPMLAVFLLFINIHHYFIDSSMWRSDNEQMRLYLFGPPTKNQTDIIKNKKAA